MVVVFGSLNLDLVARVPRLPAPGETCTGTAFFTAPGGKGANQALAARNAGAEVALFGAVGADAFAAQALSNLRAAGINLDGVATVAAPTGVALINVADDGENSIVVVPGANALARATQVYDHALGETGTLLAQLEIPLAEVAGVFRRAQACRMRCVLNAAPMTALPPSLFEFLDVLVVNEHEAKALAATVDCPGPPERLIRELHAHFGVLTVVTLGARGALTLADGRLQQAEPPPVEVRDATGAGDAFVGAMCAAFDRGEKITRALAEGVAAGALACAEFGAQAALPDAARIRAATENVELRYLP